MLLTVLKHDAQWDFLACTFQFEGFTYERIITRFTHIVAHSMHTSLVLTSGERYSMAHMFFMKKLFNQQLFCRYAVEVTFYQTNRTIGILDETKLSCSVKHKLVRYKVYVCICVG